jgi:hypothetical protein
VPLSPIARGTGLSPQLLAELVAELGPRWQARQDAGLADRPRQRRSGPVPGIGWCSSTGCWPPWCTCATESPDVLACSFGVSRSTITRAVEEVRPLLAERGCTVEGGVRLRTLANVVAP